MGNTPFFQSKVFKGILYSIAIVVGILIVFELGFFVGHRSALFSCQWGQNYPGNFFSRPPLEMDRFFDNRGNMRPHGSVGEIIKIENTSLVVKAPDEAEKTVLIKDDTNIEKNFGKIKATDLVVGDRVVLFGSPNTSGQIEAKVVRVLPPFVPLRH